METLAVSLQEFNELNSVVALRHIIKDINLQKIINIETCMIILNNVAIYIQYLSLETNQSQWTLVLQEFETLFRQMEQVMIKSADYTCLFLIMGSLLKVPAIATTKVMSKKFILKLKIKTKFNILFLFEIVKIMEFTGFRYNLFTPSRIFIYIYIF